MRVYFKLPFLLSILLITAVSGLQAQIPFFKSVQVSKTGVPLKINGICQDTDKFIWLATTDGLYRYSGGGFEKIVLKETTEPADVSSIAPLPDGGVIFGNRKGGIFKFLNGVVRAIPTGSLVVHSSIGGIAVSPQHEIFVALQGQGLLKIAGDKIENFTTQDGLPDNYLYDVAIDPKGNLWIGSDGGLTKWSGLESKNAFQNFTTVNGLPDNIVRRIDASAENSIGIGTEEGGFVIYYPGTNTFFIPEFFREWSKGSITSILKLENEYWIGTQRDGIVDYEFKGYKRTRQFTKNLGFEGVLVNCMLKDHEGNIWIGSGSELYMSLGEKIEFKRELNGAQLTNIHAILADSREKVWISNDNGVFCYDAYMEKGVVDEPLLGTPFANLNVISFYEDNKGFIWMGTFDKGVIRFDPQNKEAKLFDESSGLINTSVLSIDGNRDEVWFATLGGVSKCSFSGAAVGDISNFVSFSEENGLGNNFIYKVFIDSKKRIWFGTDGHGLSCLKNGKFINYSEREGLKSRIIYSITEDPYGNIWISSATDGIYRFDGTTFRNFSVAQGLSEINVAAIRTDRKGNIVIVHKKGVDVMDPSNYQVVSFSNEMGISNIDPDINSAAVDSKGTVWIGTQKGIIKIALDARVGSRKPVLLLNNVFCFLEKVDSVAGNKFSYDRNHISFDFAGIWYADPQKLSYQYKLTGYNNEWITTRDRFITYPNLRPGDYEFMVRASINGNFIDAPTISYPFRISFPLWQRPWFLILSAVILISLFYWYLTARDKRIKSLQAIQKEKIESQYEILKNQVNPHFLFNSFNTLITVIEDDKKTAVEYVNKLSDFFRNLLSYQEKDIISIREEMELVENYIFLQQKRYGNNFKVNIDLPSLVLEKYYIPPMGIQILLENCLKHNAVSRETPLVVDIYQENYEYLVVRNNINEKVIKDPSTGIGLQNLKNRFQLLNQQVIKVTNENGFFIVKLPLIK